MIRQDKLSTAQRVLSMAAALTLLLTLPHAVGAAPPLKLFDHNQIVQDEHDETQRQIDEMNNGFEIPASLVCALLELSRVGSEKTVFVTNMAYTGNLGGTAGADDKCNVEAAAADPPLLGNYKAWVSTLADPVRDRFTKSPCPYVRTDVVQIDPSFAAIVDLSGTIMNPIDKDEMVGDVGMVPVWTDTTPSGFWHNIGFDCNNWTSDSVEDFGIVGDSKATDFHWSFNTVSTCNLPAHLYCFQQ